MNVVYHESIIIYFDCHNHYMKGEKDILFKMNGHGESIKQIIILAK